MAGVPHGENIWKTIILGILITVAGYLIVHFITDKKDHKKEVKEKKEANENVWKSANDYVKSASKKFENIACFSCDYSMMKTEMLRELDQDCNSLRNLKEEKLIDEKLKTVIDRIISRFEGMKPVFSKFIDSAIAISNDNPDAERISLVYQTYISRKGPADPEKPRAPRRHRLRPAARRRRRHPDPDAGCVLPRGNGEAGRRPSGARQLRRRDGVPAAGPGQPPRLRAGDRAFLRAVDVGAHRRLQGHAAGRPGRRVLPRPAGSAHGVGAGPGAPALLDQHLPDLEPGASLSHDRHNGEINTLRGNVNWMARAAGDLKSPVLGRPRQAVAADPDGQSDTACLDNALELLVMGGYSWPTP
jgi:hypothetical protein